MRVVLPAAIVTVRGGLSEVEDAGTHGLVLSLVDPTCGEKAVDLGEPGFQRNGRRRRQKGRGASYAAPAVPQDPHDRPEDGHPDRNDCDENQNEKGPASFWQQWPEVLTHAAKNGTQKPAPGTSPELSGTSVNLRQSNPMGCAVARWSQWFRRARHHHQDHRVLPNARICRTARGRSCRCGAWFVEDCTSRRCDGNR